MLVKIMYQKHAAFCKLISAHESNNPFNDGESQLKHIPRTQKIAYFGGYFYTMAVKLREKVYSS